ncbi:MAG: hypothetical protein ACOC8Y_05910, partial [Candidatus Natronoplasma sp.]
KKKNSIILYRFQIYFNSNQQKKEVKNVKEGDLVTDKELGKLYLVIEILKERGLAKVKDGNRYRTVPVPRLKPI